MFLECAFLGICSYGEVDTQAQLMAGKGTEVWNEVSQALWPTEECHRIHNKRNTGTLPTY